MISRNAAALPPRASLISSRSVVSSNAGFGFPLSGHIRTPLSLGHCRSESIKGYAPGLGTSGRKGESPRKTEVSPLPHRSIDLGSAIPDVPTGGFGYESNSGLVGSLLLGLYV